jgi:hypothetical protein
MRRYGRSPARCSNPDRTCVSHVDLGHNCDVSIVRLLRLRRRPGLSVLARFLVVAAKAAALETWRGDAGRRPHHSVEGVDPDDAGRLI